MLLPKVVHLAAACSILLPLASPPIPTSPSLIQRTSCKCPSTGVFVCTLVAIQFFFGGGIPISKERKGTSQGEKRLI